MTDPIALTRAACGLAQTIDASTCAGLLDLLEQTCRRHAAQPAFSGLGHTLSYAELDRLASDFAAWVQHDTPLQPGDRIAIQMPNLLQYPVVLFGALRAGLVVVNTNPLYTPREMRQQFRDAGVRALVVLDHFADKLPEVLPETDIRLVVLTAVEDLHPASRRWLIHAVTRYVQRQVPRVSLRGVVPLRTALSMGERHAFVPVPVRAETLAVLQYTGGTTGVAKGAMLSHGNLLANTLQGGAIFATFGMGDGNRPGVFVLPLPLYHIYAFTLSMIMLAGGHHTLLIANPRDIAGLLRAWRRWPVAGFCGLNTLFVALCSHPGFARLDFSRLRVTISGGMALTRQAADDWQRITGQAIAEGYGLTETSPVVAVNPAAGIRQGTVGIAVPSTELKVIDAEGHALPPGQAGELCVRGPQVMQGYWQRPQETRQVLDAQGWLHTGDVAVIEPDGYLRIVDRLKDMILVSGFNVYPNEIEDVISTHPDVLECAAIGIPDAQTGEAVKLFVVLRRPGLDSDTLLAWARQRLVAYKLPRQIEWRDSLPKSTVGKVLRRALRDAG